MWRTLMSSNFASWVVGLVRLPKPRQVQQALDLQRLYVVTQFRKAALAGKTPSMQLLIHKSQALEPSAVRREVEQDLQAQVLAVAETLHASLAEARDPASAAAGMAAACQRLEARRAREASGLSKLARGLWSALPQREPQAAKEESARVEASSSSGGPVLTQAALSAALRRRVGYSLAVRPSTVPHPEAGEGLFLEGEARAGSVVAIFPGVLYGRTQLAHMPNFPKVDTDNPYLSCRYDQSIVDSKPWGRGDPGTTASSAGAAAADAPRAPAAGLATAGEPASGSGQGAGGWWTWAGPLSASLAYLEGRHPLALAHYVNHPGAGQAPNVLEASLDVPIEALGIGSGRGGGSSPRPWLRAYLPAVQPPLQYDPYGKYDERDADDDDGSDDEDDADDANARRGGGAGPGAPAAAGMRPQPKRAPGEMRPTELLRPPGGVVRLLVLVATRGVRDGEELLQNYRMNPHVARPAWYLVHDAEAEQRRWAKSRALDLGFKGSPAPGSGGVQKGDNSSSAGGG